MENVVVVVVAVVVVFLVAEFISPGHLESRLLI